jgi:hypothetical protein
MLLSRYVYRDSHCPSSLVLLSRTFPTLRPSCPLKESAQLSLANIVRWRWGMKEEEEEEEEEPEELNNLKKVMLEPLQKYFRNNDVTKTS